MTKREFRKKIIETVEERSILKHPFYVKWNEGKLTMDELREYAKQYYKFVENFPTFVSAVHSNCKEQNVRKLMMENLADEEGFKTGIPEHPSLWLNFCSALGIDIGSVHQTKPINETKKMVSGFYEYCRNSDYKTGIAALLSYEYQIPEVSSVKINGLRKFYGVESEKAIEFFTVHEKADVYHREAELNILVDKCTEGEQKRILDIIAKAAGLYWQMLDGVYVN